jgi:hypothetical protein
MILKILSILLLLQFAFSIDPKNIKIPSKYITDSSFISMLTKAPASLKTLYASPSGSGSSCTNSSPCSLSTALGKLQKGYTLYLKKGNYNVKSGVNIRCSGTSNSYILISSAPGETAVITSSKTDSVGLFEITGSYIIIENITFKNVEAKNVQGIVFYEGGQNHIIIRNNVFNSLKTTKVDKNYGANGILLMGESEKGIKQVIIYKNTLTNNVLGYSEAISVAGNCQEIYVLDNYLKDNTNIGIDFYGNAGYCKNKKLDQPRISVAMYNYIEKSVSKYASCAGLYIDGSRDIYVAENTVVNSQYGIEIGAEEKIDDYPVKNIIVKNNILKGNTETALRIGGFEEHETGVVQNCNITDNTISGSHTAVIVSKAKDINIIGNQMLRVDIYFVDIEFSSTYAKRINIEKNIFSGTGKFRLYKEKKISLNEFIVKYPSNKKR